MMRGSRMVVNLILLVLTFVAIVSCRNERNLEALSHAESLMEEHPDSSLSILDTISVKSLSKEKDMALYGLLMTMALDKNNLDPVNDSLISFSVDYYGKTKDKQHELLSQYYRGRVQYLNNEFSKSMVSFIKSKELAEEDSLFFWIGMSCRGISDIYNATFNTAEEAVYAEREYEYIKRSGRQPYLNYSLLDYGRALVNNEQHDKALNILSQVLDSARVFGDMYLETETQRLMADRLLNEGDYRSAKDVLQMICKDSYATSIDSLKLSLAYVETGDVGEAKDISSMCGGDDIWNAHVKKKIFSKLGLYELSLKESDKVEYLSERYFKRCVKENVSGEIANYYESNQRIQEAELQSMRLTRLIWVLVLFVILVAACVLFIYKIRCQKIEILNKVALAEQMQETLSNKESIVASLDGRIKSLISSKYELLERLSKLMVNSGDSNTASRKIAECVTKLIDDISLNGEEYKDLEKSVDIAYGNLMTDFKNDLPKLKDQDYRLYLFSVLRFSMPVIALFLKEDKIESVYNRKRRIKDKIRQLNDVVAGRYLTYMS